MNNNKKHNGQRMNNKKQNGQRIKSVLDLLRSKPSSLSGGDEDIGFDKLGMVPGLNTFNLTFMHECTF